MKTFFILLFVSAFPLAHAKSDPTLQCNKRKAGDWNYGAAADGCDVTPVQAKETVLNQFGPAVLLESKLPADRKRYMTDFYAVVKAMGSYYIHRRNPNVSALEEEGFLQALFTVVTTESVWSHYRLGTDGIARYMRGDNLHGYGLMQLDDRSYLRTILKGRAQDLIYNMSSGLDQFYTYWVQSAHLRCIKSAGDYKSRARSSWAAYNGGPGSICRWTNSRSPHAEKDRTFKVNYEAKAWLSFVKDEKAESKLDVRCMAEGKRPCKVGK